MTARAICLATLLAVLTTEGVARADDTTTTVLVVLGVGQVAQNALSSLTFAAVDIAYAARGRRLHKGWAVPQLVFGTLSVVAGGINLAVGGSLLQTSGGLGGTFVGLGAVVMATGIWYIGHAAYALRHRPDPYEDVPPAVAPPPPPLAPYFVPVRGGAVAGIAMRF